VTLPSWLRRVLGWLAPSAVAAALGALVAGVVEGLLLAHGPLELGATASYSALLAIPALLAGGAIVRGLWIAWRPRELAGQLIDERGAAPRVAAWAIYLVLAGAFLSLVTGNAYVWLALSYKTLFISLVLPAIVVTAAAVAVALSRPVVDLLAIGLARWERRRATHGRAALLTPRKILATIVVIALAALAFAWLVVLRPRLVAVRSYYDLRIFAHPVVAIAAAVAVHALWRRRPRWQRPAALAASAAALAMVATVATTRQTAPALVLDVWSRPTVAGLAIDWLFDVNDLRNDMALTAFKPVERTKVHPDVVLITIDTVRADRTPLYGGPAHMPALASLGERGAVFDWAFSPGNVTRRSIPSIVLGESPMRVHGRVAGWALKLDPRHVLLAERFRAAGYDTAGFVCCDSFWLPEHELGINRGLDLLYIKRPGAELAAAMRDWIAERDKAGNTKPVFIWIHFIEVHDWAGDNPDPHIDDNFRKKYDGVLTQVDRFLGDAIGAFAQRPPDRQPIIAVTADHGEGLGDHGVAYHSIDLYDSLVHVPLVITGPGVPTHHVAEPVALVDLAPTLLELAGFAPPGMPDMDGVSVADLATGARKGDPDGGYAFMAQVADRSVADSERAVVQGRWKLIDNGGRLELYDLHLDLNEMHDMSREKPAELAKMKQLLEKQAALDDVSPFP
jgi:arylsulfatase A-like enzyme